MFNLKEKEEEVLGFWKNNKIYEKSKKKNSKGKKFYMMDGPPYANGNIHLGTALNKILKDIAMRSRRLQGYNVFDRPGYDTHGIPIEFQIEKELGFKSKKDIEKLGVDKFVQKCKDFASSYIGTMNKQFERIGVWMDWNNPYITFSDEYIEAIWHAFKEADKKELLYLGKYPVHVCPRCETAVSYNEIVYEKQKDKSIFVKFPLKNKEKTYLVIFTTTPWTLPGNTGIMVNPDVLYEEVETSNGDRLIIAKELVQEIMQKSELDYKKKRDFKGSEMKGWEYENPIAKYLKLKIKNGYKVVLSSRYVTTEEGTGLVHCAPGHGKEDYEVGKENGLDMPSPVSTNGILTEEAGKYAGKKAREVDQEIIEDLRRDGFLIYDISYEHEYPLCWRDKTPLLMISQPQWFLKISKIHEKLIKENEKNNWVPSWMKLRMKAWLNGISDWPVSRQRYWGTPLPIWYNEKTGEKVVIGSIEELRKLSGKKQIDVHKPGIDKIEIRTESGNILKRVPEVLDVWFDSGVSSWAALGYPKNKEQFKKFWPADLNIEGKDQIRGWWNSQLILSVIAFDKKPFENIIVHGMILDLGKIKMSKSLGNVITPESLIENYGRDYMRYYFAKTSKGEDFSFDEKNFLDIQRMFTILFNINNFTNQILQEKDRKKDNKNNSEDKWIISKYNRLVKEVRKSYNDFKFSEAVNLLESFVVNELSRTYIQMIRDRTEKASDLLNEIRIGVLKLLAPIIPFLTEAIWRELRDKKIVKEESVHLSDWPNIDEKKINEGLEKDFENAKRIIELGLAERDKAKIGLRWPLASATVNYSSLSKELQEIILRQINVKRIIVKKDSSLSVALDTKITPDLEAEGFSRELARKIQAERKNAGLVKEDIIDIYINCDGEMREMLSKHLVFLKERTNSKKIEFAVEKILKKPLVFTVRERKISFFIRNYKGAHKQKDLNSKKTKKYEKLISINKS